MSAVYSIRSYLHILVICSVIAGSLAEARAQKRVFARVDPNVDSINSSAEIYDPTNGTFTRQKGLLTEARQSHTAVLLRDGRVLLTGGYNGAILSSAETYHPGTGLFAETSETMGAARLSHTATLLQSGRVLVTGGYNGSEYLNSAEVFSPSADTFTKLSNTLVASRAGHSATLLTDGTVLIAGGYSGSTYLSSAELYDPIEGTFTATTGSMTVAREGHTATLLQDGRVLITGGYNSAGVLGTAEIYDPDTEKFTAISGTMSTARQYHSATLLSSGKVLIAGGLNSADLSSADIYDPSSGKFSPTSGNMSAAREAHTATLLPSGKVLISGGYNGSYLSSTETYDPATGSFTASPSSMSVARHLHSATMLLDGKVLVAGGQNAKLLLFDVNSTQSDNISPNIVFSADSKVGWVSFTGSGTVVAFSAETGNVLKRIETGGYPTYATLVNGGKALAVVSALSDKIFLIDTTTLSLESTYTFANATFGFGSMLSLSPNGSQGYISSTGTGQVIRFNVDDGKETGRVSSLYTPAQITVSLDGSILMIVDTSLEELVFADSSSMTKKFSLNPRDTFSTADLTIFNKAVLAPDGSAGIIACRDTSGGSGMAFIFKTTTGEILDTETVGTAPGFTALTPNGQNWVILNDLSLSLIPSYDPKAMQKLETAQGSPLGSANISFSTDSKYAFYAASADDLFFQHDLLTGGVVGQVLLGDDPNKALDQPAAVAITPDGKTVATIELMGNKIDLLTDVTTLEAPKFLISGDQFTGLDLVNLSDRPAELTIYALDNYGQVITEDDLTNPVTLTLDPNAQLTQNVSEIFNFDPTKDHNGRLSIYSENPQVVGYLSVGQIAATWFGYYLNRMDGAPLFKGQLYDWVVPQLSAETGWNVQLDLTSTNYTSETYDIEHYAKDGTLVEEKADQTAYPTNRLENSFSDIFTSPGGGKVLVAGGQTTSTTDSTTTTTLNSTTETYDEDTRKFTSGGSMTRARQGHSATLLMNGNVLIAGGKNSSTIFASAETYDITAGTFSATESGMTAVRYRHTATLLSNGKVLLAGGQNSNSVNDTADLYDPTENTFSETTGTMTTPRDAHTATRLPNGKVLIAGGINGSTVTGTAELFDPDTQQFTAAGSMTTGRAFHTAMLLPNGRVLLAGGYNGNYLNTAEIYDPLTGKFTATSGTMRSRRSNHTATLMPGGKVLLAGGSDGTGASDSVETYDYQTDAFVAVASAMASPRSGHTATLLSDGTVLIVGGSDGTNDVETAETYDPVTLTFEATEGNPTTARSGHTATYLDAGSEGYLRVSCPKGLTFTEFYQASRDGGVVNGIDVQKYVGVTRLYAPQFAITSGFKTRLNLINANSDENAEVTITLHAADGKVLGTPVTVKIPSNGKLEDDISYIFQQASATQNTSGWLEVESTTDQVLGTFSFTNDDKTYLTSLELSGKPLTRFVFQWWRRTPCTRRRSHFSTPTTRPRSSRLSSGDRTAR